MVPAKFSNNTITAPMYYFKKHRFSTFQKNVLRLYKESPLVINK